MSRLWTRVRYTMVIGLCWALRHPTQRVEYADGVAWTTCPCRYIEISDRPIRAAAKVVTVAAHDASGEDKAASDFVCCAPDDWVTIAAASRSLGPEGGTVQLSAGSFTLPSELPSGITLRGSGTGQTIASGRYPTGTTS